MHSDTLVCEVLTATTLMGSSQSNPKTTAQISEKSSEIRFLCWRSHRNVLKSHMIIAGNEDCRRRGAAGSTYDKRGVDYCGLLGTLLLFSDTLPHHRPSNSAAQSFSLSFSLLDLSATISCSMIIVQVFLKL